MAHFNHFNFLAPYYDWFMKPTDPARMCALAGLPVSGNLLDVGGGTGLKAYMLKDWVTGIVIADSSMGMLAQATKKTGLTTVCSNSEELPFEDESFERVIMVDAFHHVYNYHETSNELWRVVKPGGRIVIEEPDIKTFPVKIMAIVEKLVFMRSHVVSPLTIRNCFRYSNASANIESEGSISWVIIDKQSG